MDRTRILVEKGDLNAALAELGLRLGRAIDFNVEYDPRQDLLYEGLDQDPGLRRRALSFLRRRRGAEARLLEGAVHFAYREFPEAVKALERAAARDPRWLPARLWLFRARGYRAMHVKDVAMLRAAVELSREIERDEPRCFLLCAWRAELHTGFDLHAEALADLSRALELRPDYAWAHAETADIYTQQHRLAPALSACAKLIALFPHEGFGYAIRGRAYGKCGRPKEALADLDRAVNLGPKLGAAFAWRGEARRRAGDLAGALADFAQARRLAPAYPLTFLWSGAAWLQKGDYRRAARDLSESIRLDPRNLLAFAWRAEALIKLGRLKEAISDLDEFFPSNLRGTWTGGAEGLAADMEEVAAQRPRNPLARALRGRFRLEDPNTDPALALEDLDAAVRALPKDAWCRAWRAQVLGRLGRASEAAADLDAAVRLKPRWAWAWAWRGKFELDADRPRAALRDLERSLRLSPILGQAFEWRAQARRALGLAEGSARDAESAFALGHRERSVEPVGGPA